MVLLAEVEAVGMWGAVVQSGAAVITAAVFIWYLRYREEKEAEERNAARESFKQVSIDCHEHSAQIVSAMAKALEKSDKVIQENTKILGETNARLDNVAHEVSEFREQIRNA